jgi:anti-anti-sigma regulatory factor
MKLFLSWSGEESRRTAETLKTWLQGLFKVEAWMSAHDIDAGSPWATTLHDQLRQADFGVLCLNVDNVNSPWILYEAGALATNVKTGCVVPYLMGIEPSSLPGPLGKFQSVQADEEGTWNLVRSISTLAEHHQNENLREKFAAQWPTLVESLGLALDISIQGGVVIVKPTTSQISNLIEIQALKEKMRTLVQAGQKKFVIDLSRVKFIPSSGMSFLIFMGGGERRFGYRVLFTGLNPPVIEMLELTKVIMLIRQCNTIEEALSEINQGA